MTRLDEGSLRRPDFSPGEAIVLADDQPWTLPIVEARLDVRFLTTAGDATSTVMRIGFAEPLERVERLKQGLPRHQGQRFEGFEAN